MIKIFNTSEGFITEVSMGYGDVSLYRHGPAADDNSLYLVPNPLCLPLDKLPTDRYAHQLPDKTVKLSFKSKTSVAVLVKALLSISFEDGTPIDEVRDFLNGFDSASDMKRLQEDIEKQKLFLPRNPNTKVPIVEVPLWVGDILPQNGWGWRALALHAKETPRADYAYKEVALDAIPDTGRMWFYEGEADTVLPWPLNR